VIEARAKATSIQLNAGDLTPEKMAQFEAAQQQLTGALSRLMVTVERYPDLKTTTAFRDFQAQYEGMENRIGVERRKFNDLARAFNSKIKQIPNNMLAGSLRIYRKGLLQGARRHGRCTRHRLQQVKSHAIAIEDWLTP
jgi:LemA protein